MYVSKTYRGSTVLFQGGVRLPESLHNKAKELAEREGISHQSTCCYGVGGKRLSALMTVEHLEKRARGGKRPKFDAVLKHVPDRGRDQAE